MENKLRYVKGWKKRIKALIPRRAKYTFFAGIIEFLLKRTRWLDGGDEPPPFMDFSGGGFIPLGDQLVRLMIERAGLAGGMKVVDIGCGIGRNAVALSKRFPDDLSYVGFDIVRFGILWCQKRFSTQKNYSFVHADIFNSFYNPYGMQDAASYSFPCADRSADFAFATSVYTHMKAYEVRHYLAETARCLRPGGVAYCTCFIMDSESHAQINAGRTLFRFRHDVVDAFVESASEPELAVAFERGEFEEMATGAGLNVVAFYPGSWRGIGYADFQDAYVFQVPKATREQPTID